MPRLSLSLVPVVALSGVVEARDCFMPLDVMFLQDTTGSFDEDLPNVVNALPDMIADILTDHPGSRFGVAEFKDKPYYPLGETTDFCYKLGDYGWLSSDLTDIQWAYSNLYASGGGDYPEAMFQALINIAKDPAVRWRPHIRDDPENGAGARLVIISTDARPHLPGDIDNFDPLEYPDLPRNLPKNSGTISTDDITFECILQDYPSPEQVRDALRDSEIILSILTPEETEDDNVVEAWQWVNEKLMEQPASYYQFISNDSSDFLDGVLKVIRAYTEVACPSTEEPEVESTESTESVINDVTDESGKGPETTTPAETIASVETTSVDTATTITTSTDNSRPSETTTSSTTETIEPDECTADDCPTRTCDEGNCIHGMVVRIGQKPKHVEVKYDA